MNVHNNDRDCFSHQDVKDNKNTTGFAIMADESVCLDSPTSGSGDPDPGKLVLNSKQDY